jgi:hypothetical protein
LAKQAVYKALELDDSNCDAHVVLSWQYDWDWPTAEKEYRRALELCPNDCDIYYTAVNGRIAESRAEIDKTRELDAIRSVPFVAESVINYHLRDYKALIEIGRAFVAQNSNDWLAHHWLGLAMRVQANWRKRFWSIRKLSSYHRAIQILLLRWRTRMQRLAERQRRRRFFANS